MPPVTPPPGSTLPGANITPPPPAVPQTPSVQPQGVVSSLTGQPPAPFTGPFPPAPGPQPAPTPDHTAGAAKPFATNMGAMEAARVLNPGEKYVGFGSLDALRSDDFNKPQRVDYDNLWPNARTEYRKPGVGGDGSAYVVGGSNKDFTQPDQLASSWPKDPRLNDAQHRSIIKDLDLAATGFPRDPNTTIGEHKRYVYGRLADQYHNQQEYLKDPVGPSVVKSLGINVYQPSSRDSYDTSTARSVWNGINRMTGGLPGVVTNQIGLGASGLADTWGGRLVTKPLTERVGLGNPKLPLGEWSDRLTGGAASRTLSPEIVNMFNIGTSPLELLAVGAPVVKGLQLARGAKAAPGIKPGVNYPIPEAVPGPGMPTPRPPGMLPRTLPPDSVPYIPTVPGTLPPSTLKNLASLDGASTAAKAAPSMTGTLKYLASTPGYTRTALEGLSGLGAITAPARLTADVARRIVSSKYRQTPFRGGMHSLGMTWGHLAPATVSTEVPDLVLGERVGSEQYKERMQNPTARFLDPRFGNSSAPYEPVNTHAFVRRFLGPPVYAVGTARSLMGYRAPNYADLVSDHWRNLDRAAGHMVDNVPYLSEAFGRSASRAFDTVQNSLNPNDQSNKIAVRNRMVDDYDAAVKAFTKGEGINNPDAADRVKVFRDKVRALRDRAAAFDGEIDPDAARNKLLAEEVRDVLRKEYADNPDALEYIDRQYAENTNYADSLEPPTPSDEKGKVYKFPYMSERDRHLALVALGRSAPGMTPKNLTPEQREAIENEIYNMTVKMRNLTKKNFGPPRLKPTPTATQVEPTVTTPVPAVPPPTDFRNGTAYVPPGQDKTVAAAPMPRVQQPQPQPQPPPVVDTQPKPVVDNLNQTAGKPPAGVQTPPTTDKPVDAVAVRERLSGSIAAGGGLPGALDAASKAPPPAGFEAYWENLPPSSKWLAIGGLSIAAITTLRRLFSSGDDDDESFLSRVLPLLGLGVGAWGLGGGTLGFSRENLPSMQNYKNLGNATVNFVGRQFGK